MPKVTFVYGKEKKEVEVPEGANLREEALKAGVPVYAGLHRYLNCRGLGLCGTCRVLITKGMENCNPLTMSERLKFKAVTSPDPVPALAYVGHEDTMRLACCVKVHGDIEVESGPEVNLFGENFFS